MQEHEQVFLELPLLAKLPRDDLRELAAIARVQTFRTGAVIFRQGEPGDSLHAIVEGAVRIDVVAPGGNETTMAILGPGECFGELAILDGRPRSANAIANQPTRTLVVTRNDFIRWLSDKPKSALLLLETLSLRLRSTNEAFVDLAFFDLSHRLARRLLRLAEPKDAAGVARPGARVTTTQSALASMLGVSRESVNKQLGAFAAKGWIEAGRGYVELKDPQALREVN
ncbi:MAG TPA: Crp/Fnr family transcriptional regulator [Dehalococcoidia bacterium]|nr:Crp/Fnr family transcriptional regulator [Dehalococcoidia bacterium]